MTATLIPAADRHFWENEWLTSRQSFPGTGNFDIFANAHGVLAMHNDDVIGPGEGLDNHAHQNMEILTWVVEGAVWHKDSHGNTETIGTGSLGAMTAGKGITHTERNAAARASRESVRVVQMWVPPHTDELEPAHSTRDFNVALASGEPVVVASGRPEHADSDALHIENRFATLHIARPRTGQTITLPGAPFGHLFTVRGSVSVSGNNSGSGSGGSTAGDDLVAQPLAEGDAIRFTDSGPLTVTATDDAEIVYWEMYASFDRAH
ncbi:MAG: pirin family protein [Gordonia sp. (in: high G+C Gram-positive bacteria)]|uniref:pirin family protein n=1 Tax=Gordonia sp. (in: high G+C Gram-positive bacteria) TaxID=84139 RepID=UPI003C77C9F3